jgi:hypothetical protein
MVAFEQGSLAYQLNRLAFGFLPVKNLFFSVAVAWPN